MTEQATIWIRYARTTDPDDVFGGEGSGGYDAAESAKAFDTLVMLELRRLYPDAEIEMVDRIPGPVGSLAVQVDGGDRPWEIEQSVLASGQQAIETVLTDRHDEWMVPAE